MNSYQKLKEENKKLRKIIEELVFNPDSADSINIKFHFKLLRDVENAVMAGSVAEQIKTPHSRN